MTTKETVQSYFLELERKGNWEKFLAEDMVFTSYVAQIKKVRGKAAYIESTKRFFSMVTEVEVREVIVDGEKACALTRYKLQPPVGNIFNSEVAEIFHVRDGKIDSFDIYFDNMAFPEQ